MCFYTSGMVEDFRQQMEKINKIILDTSKIQLDSNEIHSKLTRIIQFHSEILE